MDSFDNDFCRDKIQQNDVLSTLRQLRQRIQNYKQTDGYVAFTKEELTYLDQLNEELKQQKLFLNFDKKIPTQEWNQKYSVMLSDYVRLYYHKFIDTLPPPLKTDYADLFLYKIKYMIK